MKKPLFRLVFYPNGDRAIHKLLLEKQAELKKSNCLIEIKKKTKRKKPILKLYFPTESTNVFYIYHGSDEIELPLFLIPDNIVPDPERYGQYIQKIVIAQKHHQELKSLGT